MINTLHWRYAVKKFDSTKVIPPELWQQLEEALVLTPSSYGLQPWKFLIIKDPAVRKQLMSASWGQSQVVDASHFVVFVGLKKVEEAYVDKYIQRVAEVRKMAAEALDGFKKIIMGDLVNGPRSSWVSEWAARQTYIALGNFMNTAAALQIDTCAMEGLDPQKYDEILNLKDGPYRTLCACAAGYRSAEDKYAGTPKVRFEAKDVIQYV
jgi:nitroreductase